MSTLSDINKKETNDLSQRNHQPNRLLGLLPRSHLNAWHTDNLGKNDLCMTLPDSCVDELDQALARTGDAEIPDTSNRQLFKSCYDFALELSHRLDHGALGAVIVDRLPAERYNEMDNRRVCGMFSSFVGPLMKQNFAGVTLYDVKNTNPSNPEKVRKSITNHAQPFHTDGGWHRVPAKYVGLYCVRNARSGGGSKITSMIKAFDSMSEHSDQLQVLLNQHPWDMQGEHDKDEQGVMLNPVFEAHEGQFLSRYYESYVRNGYKLVGEDIPAELNTALNTLLSIIESQNAIRFEMTSGQFQYLNNWSILHGRELFHDNETTPEDETRHVIRVWNH